MPSRDFYICRLKTKYTKKEVKLRQSQKRSQKGKAGSVYKCRNCRKYHISSQPKNFIKESTWEKIKRENNRQE